MDYHNRVVRYITSSDYMVSYNSVMGLSIHRNRDGMPAAPEAAAGSEQGEVEAWFETVHADPSILDAEMRVLAHEDPQLAQKLAIELKRVSDSGMSAEEALAMGFFEQRVAARKRAESAALEEMILLEPAATSRSRFSRLRRTSGMIAAAIFMNVGILPRAKAQQPDKNY